MPTVLDWKTPMPSDKLGRNLNTMKSLFRILPTVLFLFSVAGCSSVTTKQSSELRADLETSFDRKAISKTEICVAPQQVIGKPTPIYTAPEPFAAKLYFLLDQVVFTDESEQESHEIYQKILNRKPSEVFISGHTDTSASNNYNEALSQRRAERVKQDLVKAGLAEDIITITSEGEYRLLVSTPDETVEVRNRRVEITLR
jgi:OOP family OmpA-OmpF porin